MARKVENSDPLKNEDSFGKSIIDRFLRFETVIET